MNQKGKRKLSIAACLMLTFTLLLSGCGSKTGTDTSAADSGSGGKNEQVTIKYYNWDNADQTPKTDALLKQFEQENPNIKVEHVVLVPGNSQEMLKKLDFLISSGEAVDVVAMPSLGAVNERAARGALAPLNDYYKASNLVPEDEYYVNPKIGDKYYGMQLTNSYQYVLLNKDALDEAGLKVPTYGWTWDDYRDYAKKLTKGEGVDKRYGSYFHTWELYMNAPAQTVMKNPFRYEDGTSNFSDPTYKYFFQLRKDMETVDKSAKPYSDVLAAKLNYRTEFFNGDAAMILSGSFMTPDPGNTEQYPHTFKTAFAPVPLPPKNAEPKDYEGGKYFVGGNHVVMGASSKHKEESFKLMRFMTTVDSDSKMEFSGWKKADNNAVLNRLIGKNSNMYDVDSLKSTLFGEHNQFLEASQVVSTTDSEMMSIEDDGFSKFMLGNTPIEEVQKWMVDEATKVIKEKESK
ncbi:ABC transporter substrate-binding protein [Paenibacillus sp. J22TS3]|uniref:ABC transporter substrate-binding protein n=1 Tax=Paenibacillus sp. J22TS3 TaxID=2807192 RepID=UPI001B26080D|nr:extracellular solute-binding protein [Paenibacillus sp. J22TS3]GIP21008.1 ABC transporter substrate-binding protein [Paenibacillus sp. J22TS3]